MITNPVSQTAVEGADGGLHGGRGRHPPLSYQWQFNGANLAGATGTCCRSQTSLSPRRAPTSPSSPTRRGLPSSQPAALTVTVLPPAGAALSVLTYNVHGSAVTNWSTNSLQVQAIGRQMQYLAAGHHHVPGNPDEPGL